MPSNLQKGWQNTYYRVVQPFDVLALRGIADSNAHYGSSMIMRNVYERIRLRKGDEVHGLFGGDFVHRGKDHFEARIKLSTKSIFEKQYGGPPVEQWPLDCLEEIAPEMARPWKGRPKSLRFPNDVAGKGEPVGHDLIVTKAMVLQAELHAITEAKGVTR